MSSSLLSKTLFLYLVIASRIIFFAVETPDGLPEYFVGLPVIGI